MRRGLVQAVWLGVPMPLVHHWSEDTGNHGCVVSVDIICSKNSSQCLSASFDESMTGFAYRWARRMVSVTTSQKNTEVTNALVILIHSSNR